MAEQKDLIYGGRVPYVEPLTEERAAYNEVLRIYDEEGAFSDDYKGPPIAPFASTLRSDLRLTGSLAAPNVMEFNFRTNQVNPGMITVGDADNRLDDNDAFMVREVSLSFGVKLDAAAPDSSAVLQQWPNTAAKSGLLGGGFAAAGGAALMRVYNGSMDLEVNAIKFMEGMDCLNFIFADQAQMGTLLFTASNQAFNAFGGSKGWKSLTPQMRFSGSDKTQFRVNVKSPLTFVDAAFVTIASLQLRGLRIQNGGKFVSPRTR